MSRPRRFGKSLTLSVLKALFSGRRELFEGLFIAEKTDWNWNETYPIIHFEFNDVTTTSVEDFEESFAIHVQERLENAGYSYDKALPPPENFGKAIEVVSEDRQSNGRADIVAKHKRGIYIFELKVDEPVDKAFAQIREKKYAEPYLADGRPIWLIGLSFDSKTRHLVDFAAVRYGGKETGTTEARRSENA